MFNRKKIKVLLLMIAITFFAISTTHAGDDSKIGTAAASELLIPVGARALAMGGANIAVVSGLDALYWNPAGLPRLENSAAGQFSTMTIFNDITVNYFAVGFNAEDIGCIGFSIKALDFGDISVTTREDEDGTSGRTFSPTFVTLGLTYAKNLTDAVNVGFTAKMIYESFPRVSASAVAFDFGLQYDRLGGLDGVSFGVAIKNIGGSMQYEGSALKYRVNDPVTSREDYVDRPAAKDELPAAIEMGLTYKKSVMENSSVTVASMFQSNNFENDVIKFGAEYAYEDFLFVRGGYNFMQNTEAEDQLYGLTLGAGINYSLGDVNLTLDYAFRDDQYFDANNMFSLSIGF